MCLRVNFLATNQPWSMHQNLCGRTGWPDELALLQCGAFPCPSLAGREQNKDTSRRQC